MLYRTMPQNGDKLSALGFGAMRLQLLEDGSVDEPRAIAQIRSAIDNGVNYIDTAYPYLGGQSETIVGKAIKDGYREKVKIATKLPRWLVEKREDMDRLLEEQLKKLDVDHIDYYLVHALDGNSWDHMVEVGIIDFLDTAVADGRIGNAGFSFHGVGDDFIRIVDAYPWVFCQIQYNFLDTQNQAGTRGLKYAAEKGLGVIIMEPLRGGNISLPVAPPEVQKIWDTATIKRSPVEWALRWVWDAPEVTVVLSGMNEEAHIKQNLAIASEAAAHTLTKEELALIEKAAAKYGDLMAVPCTGCGYCVPCPVGVRIPLCFEKLNHLHMFKDEMTAKYQYAVLLSDTMGTNPGYASQCVECGECLEKCPQHIDIPEVLKQVVDELESDNMEDMAKGVLKPQK
ncbi:aldo/keto reductase [Desulfosediminicola sp.]|uniref:aldo/keto reductase n=1 Tax=Desulfosediminicola sp. TaxID=2886825 RepID=UPI003AF2DB62